MSQARNMKTCIVCGKSFLVPGLCQDYLYKVPGGYCCSYKHWLEAKQQANPRPKRK